MDATLLYIAKMTFIHQKAQYKIVNCDQIRKIDKQIAITYYLGIMYILALYVAFH